MNDICDFGCGRIAEFKFKTGRVCCSKYANSCPAMVEKNSKAQKKVWRRTDKPRKYTYNPDSNWSGGKTFLSDVRIKASIDPKKVFVKNSEISQTFLRKLVIKEKTFEYKCAICGRKTWRGKPLTLDLDHKNGIKNDCRKRNLRWTCPNCHSQTKTFKGKNLNSGTFKVSDKRLITLIKSSHNVRQVLVKAGLTPKAKNYDRIYKLIGEYNLVFLVK